MITQTVPALSFVTMGISLLFGIAIPVGLFIFYRNIISYGSCTDRVFISWKEKKSP